MAAAVELLQYLANRAALTAVWVISMTSTVVRAFLAPAPRTSLLRSSKGLCCVTSGLVGIPWVSTTHNGIDIDNSERGRRPECEVSFRIRLMAAAG